MNYWLVKSEPSTYSWSDFVREGKTIWDGVRNYAARNNLQAMAKGDQVLFYHSNEGREIVGLATVIRQAFPDPAVPDGPWVAVELKPKKSLKRFVTLDELKQDPFYADMDLIRLSRLSVGVVPPAAFKKILHLGGI